MLEQPPNDPYQPPADWEESESRLPPGYQPIFKQWHPLRLRYNLIMLGVGMLVALPALSSESITDLAFGALFYGIFANIFFTLGIVPECILTWLTRENDHPNLRRIVFLTGLLFSIALTLFIGLEIS